MTDKNCGVIDIRPIMGYFVGHYPVIVRLANGSTKIQTLEVSNAQTPCDKPAT